MRTTKLALPALFVLSGALTLGGTGMATASIHHAASQSCGPAHRYIDAKSAIVKAHRVVVSGKHVRLQCGGPDDSSYVTSSAVTLRVLKTATVKVWNVPEDPSQGTHTVAATHLPKWLKRNASEPIYKIYGPANGVTRLVEEWHP